MKKENNSFVLGLSIGFALVSFVALIFMTFAYLQKGEENEKLTKTKNVVEKEVVAKQAPTPKAQKPSAGAIIDVKVNDGDHFRGNKDAPVTIVEFADPQCPYCGRFHDTMKEVMKAYPDKVKWVYKHFPLDSIHPYARKAGESQECAGEQDKFWEYTDELYANQSSIKPSYFSQVAKKIKLDIDRFETCLDSGKYASKVNDDLKYGQQIGVRGTPGNFINGKSVPGAVPFSQIKSIVDSL